MIAQAPVARGPRPRVGCCLASVIGLVALIGVASAVVPMLAPRVLGNPDGISRLLPAVGPVADLLQPDAFLRSQFGIEQHAITSDPRRFDPVAGLARARDLAGADAELVSVQLAGVRSDGTLDLQASYRPAPDAEYRFSRRLAQPPPNAPPVGAGGSVTGVWYEPIVVRFSEPGQRRRITSNRSSIDDVTTGLDRRVEAPTTTAATAAPPPTCVPAALWQQALTRGAPPDAVARIAYDRDGYSFTIAGTPVNLRFGSDCQARR